MMYDSNRLSYGGARINTLIELKCMTYISISVLNKHFVLICKENVKSICCTFDSINAKFVSIDVF